MNKIVKKVVCLMLASAIIGTSVMPTMADDVTGTTPIITSEPTVSEQPTQTPAPTTPAKKEKNGWYYEKGYKYYYKDGKKVKDVRDILGKRSSYVIKVNKKKNTVTVYAKDGKKGYIIPVVAFICSTGSATPIGTFKTGIKYRWRSLFGGVSGQYATRISAPSILFHSVPYKKFGNAKSLKAKEYNKLGTRASMGCIRMRVVDCKWVYQNCKKGTKVVIYNSKTSGPLGKPKLTKIKTTSKVDPTDTSVKKKSSKK